MALSIYNRPPQFFKVQKILKKGFYRYKNIDDFVTQKTTLTFANL